MVNVAFQGEHGAYSEEAVAACYPAGRSRPYPTLRAVFAAVAAGDVQAAVVPVENSQAGSIDETYDLLLEHHERLTIIADYAHRVRHMLMALPGQTLDDVRVVLSHPQALAQSEAFLSRLDARIEPAYDTAGSARQIAAEVQRGVAAVASARAAETYGLEILAAGIETSDSNYTRFLAIERVGEPTPRPPRMQAGRKTSLVIGTSNTPGALYHALGPFAAHGVNMTKLESRPSRTRPWEYVFYLDIEGDVAAGPPRAALDALKALAPLAVVLGSYGALDPDDDASSTTVS